MATVIDKNGERDSEQAIELSSTSIPIEEAGNERTAVLEQIPTLADMTMQEAVEVNEVLAELVDTSNDTDEIFQERDAKCCGPFKGVGCCEVFCRNFWSALFFLVGIGLIVAGYIVYDTTVPGDSAQASAFTMIMFGGLFTCVLVGLGTYNLIMIVLDLLIPRCKRKNDQRKVINLVFYLSQVAFLTWIALWLMLTLLLWIFVVPGALKNSNSEAYGSIKQVVGCIILIVLAVLSSKITSLHMTQDFGTRSYTKRLRTSISYQKLLCTLLKGKNTLVSTNNLFDSTYASLIESPEASPSEMRKASFYIHVHAVNGRYLGPGTIHKVDRSNGERIDPDPNEAFIATHLFNKLYSDAAAINNTHGTEEESNEKSIATETLREIFHKQYQFSLETVDLFISLFDPDSRRSVRLQEVEHGIEETFRDRVMLSVTIQDAAQIVKSLDGAILGCFLIVASLFSLGVLNINVGTSLAALSALLLTWSFIFSNTIRAAFEGLIFVFSTHVFDVGDTVEFEGEKFEVLQLRLMSTDFLRTDGKFIRIENQNLRNIRIYNMSTSRSFSEALEFYMSMADVSQTVITELRQELQAFVKANPGDFVSVAFTVRQATHPVLTGGDGVHGPYVKCTSWVCFSRSCLLAGANNVAREKYMIRLAELFRKFGICAALSQRKLELQVSSMSKAKEE